MMRHGVSMLQYGKPLLLQNSKFFTGFLKKYRDCHISYFRDIVPCLKIIRRKETDLAFVLVFAVEEGL
jgi:hypothetical protein